MLNSLFLINVSSTLMKLTVSLLYLHRFKTGNLILSLFLFAIQTIKLASILYCSYLRILLLQNYKVSPPIYILELFKNMHTTEAEREAYCQRRAIYWSFEYKAFFIIWNITLYRYCLSYFKKDESRSNFYKYFCPSSNLHLKKLNITYKLTWFNKSM